jgi:hypothetical protein
LRLPSGQYRWTPVMLQEILTSMQSLPR